MLTDRLMRTWMKTKEQQKYREYQKLAKSIESNKTNPVIERTTKRRHQIRSWMRTTEEHAEGNRRKSRQREKDGRAIQMERRKSKAEGERQKSKA